MKRLRLKKNAKTPLVAGAFKGEPDELVDEWLEQGGNYGVLTGNINGIIVIDIDRHGDKDGMMSMRELLDAYDFKLPQTKVVKTPNDGLHYYYKLPEKYNDLQLKQNLKGYDGIDFQAHGRFVVGADSSIDDVCYQQIRHVDDLPDCPEILLEMLVDKSISKKNKERKRGWTADLLGDILSGSGEGARNIWLSQVIGRLFSTGLSHEEVKTWAMYANQIGCKPPLDTDEVLQTYTSIKKREERRMSK